MARVRILTGTQRSAREALLDNVLREHLGDAVLILPHHEYAEQRKASFFADPTVKGCWGHQPITTFERLVRSFLEANDVPVRALHPGERRLIVERAIAMAMSAGALDVLGDAAMTDGFAAHVGEVIRILKQGFVEPVTFSVYAERQDAGQFDSAVAAVYDAYQIVLQDKGAFDPDGLYWAAHELMQRPEIRGLPSVLLFDGFDEFTSAQLRVIEELGRCVDTIDFGMSIDERPSAQDRCAIALRTRVALRKLFDDVAEVACEASEPDTVSAFAASEIFWRDPPKVQGALERNLEFLPTANALDEVEDVARRVKAHIRDGAPADRIAVVTRDGAAYANRWRDVCRTFGIPTRMATRSPLVESSVGQFIVSLVDGLDHWEREAITDVLASDWFPHVEADPRDTFPILSRAAGIIAGRREWQTRITRMEDALGEGRELGLPKASDWPRAVSALVGAVEELAGSEKLVPAKATRADFARGLLQLIDDWGLRGRAEQMEGAWHDEVAAVAALCRTLDRIAAEEVMGEPLARAEFLRYLRRVMAEITLPAIDRAGVLFAPLDQVRHCRFDHVYLVGAVEGVLPKPPRSNAIYSDADFERMHRQQIEVRPPAHRIDFEMLLFARALEMAEKSLCISWPTLSAGGSALLPSPYVRELEEWVSALEIADAPEPPRFAHTIAQPENVASQSDLVRSAAAMGDMDAVAWADEARPVAAGIAIEDGRGAVASLGAYDGVLCNPENVEIVASGFDGEHIFSVSQLEAYVECPFRFFEQRVLNVSDVPLPEERFDPRISGLIMHRALEEFHKYYVGQSVVDIAEAGALDEARGRMCEMLDEAFAGAVYPGLPVAEGAVALERQRLALRLDRYLLREAAGKDGLWKPSAFEVGFATRDEDGTTDLLGPFEIEIEGELLKFAGKIDRIDEGDDGWRIVDYKSTVHWAQTDFEAGRALQLGLYALAFEKHVAPDSECVDAVFLPVGRDKKVSAIFGNRKNRRVEREAAMRASIALAVRAIRAGRFHPPLSDHKCIGCSERRACRFDATRMARKTEAEA